MQCSIKFSVCSFLVIFNKNTTYPFCVDGRFVFKQAVGMAFSNWSADLFTLPQLTYAACQAHAAFLVGFYFLSSMSSSVFEHGASERVASSADWQSNLVPFHFDSLSSAFCKVRFVFLFFPSKNEFFSPSTNQVAAEWAFLLKCMQRESEALVECQHTAHEFALLDLTAPLPSSLASSASEPVSASVFSSASETVVHAFSSSASSTSSFAAAPVLTPVIIWTTPSPPSPALANATEVLYLSFTHSLLSTPSWCGCLCICMFLSRMTVRMYRICRNYCRNYVGNALQVYLVVRRRLASGAGVRESVELCAVLSKQYLANEGKVGGSYP